MPNSTNDKEAERNTLCVMNHRPGRRYGHLSVIDGGAAQPKSPEPWKWLMELELLARRVQDPAHLLVAARLFFKLRCGSVTCEWWPGVTPAMMALTPTTVHALMAAYNQGNTAFLETKAAELHGNPVMVYALDISGLQQLMSWRISGTWRRIRREIGITSPKKRQPHQLLRLAR